MATTPKPASKGARPPKKPSARRQIQRITAQAGATRKEGRGVVKVVRSTGSLPAGYLKNVRKELGAGAVKKVRQDVRKINRNQKNKAIQTAMKKTRRPGAGGSINRKPL